MEFRKNYFYAQELRNQVTNKLNICISNSVKLPQINAPLQFCDKCNFPLLEHHCRFCHFDNLEKPLGEALQAEWRNMRFQTKADRTGFGTQPLNGDKPCYILCVDVSGSTKSTYIAPQGYKSPASQKIIQALGLEAFRHLRAYIPQQDLLLSLDSFINLRNIGFSYPDIIKSYHQSKGHSSLDIQFSKLDVKYISRKEIIQFGIYNFLEELAAKDPQALVYIVYFNNCIHVPTEDFEAFHTITDIDIKFPEDMYELGQQYAKSITVSPTAKNKERILNNFSKVPSEGQTALGPALVFCFGIASILQCPINQINIITDGCSNVGFGNIQNQIPGFDVRAYYEDITLKYGVVNSCMVNMIGFSDEKIGFDKLQQPILKTYGTASLVQINVNQQHQRIVTSQSLQNICKQMKKYIDRIKICCYQTRFALLVEDLNVVLEPAESEKKMQVPRPPAYSFCLGMVIGITSTARSNLVNFLGNLDPETEFLKFSLALDFVYGGIRNFVVNECKIQIKKGSKQEAQKQMADSLAKELQNLKLKGDFEEYTKTQNIIRKNEHLIKQDQMDEFKKQLERLKIEDVTIEKTIGRDNKTIRRLRYEDE